MVENELLAFGNHERVNAHIYLGPEPYPPNIIKSTQGRALMYSPKETSRHVAELRTMIVLDVDHHIIVTYNVLLPSHIQG